MYADLIGAIFLMAIFFLPFLLLLFFIVQSISKPINTDKSEFVRKKITNSISKHIFNAIISIIMLLIMSAITYKEYKPLAFIALFALAALLKINYKIYLDLTLKDGLIFSGTIVKADIQTSLSADGRLYETDFNYSLEIETDNGDFIKCASKIVGLIPGQRIENAYITRRTNLLLYYDVPEYI